MEVEGRLGKPTAQSRTGRMSGDSASNADTARRAAQSEGSRSAATAPTIPFGLT